MTTYSKLDDPDYLCVQIVELAAEVERLTAENQHLFDRANDVKAENERLRAALRPFADIDLSHERSYDGSIWVDGGVSYVRPKLAVSNIEQAAEALAPDYFQRGLAAAPGLIMTGTEEQE